MIPPPPPPLLSFRPPPSEEPRPPMNCYIYRISDHHQLYYVDINHPFFSDTPLNCYMYRVSDDYSLYRVNVNNSLFTVTVTCSPSIVESWGHDVKNQNPAEKVVGFNVMLGRPVQPGKGTLQLCTGERCLVFQLFQAPMAPMSLHTFLSDGSRRFISFEYGDELKNFLLNSPHSLKIRAPIISFREYMADRNASLDKIAKTYLHYDVENPTMELLMSDWSVPFLSPAQVIHASINARCAFLCGMKIF